MVSALIVALNEAERLLSLLETDGGFPNEAVRLRRRIQLVSSELESLDCIARGEERVVSSCWPEPTGASAVYSYTPIGNSPPPANGSM